MEWCDYGNFGEPLLMFAEENKLALTNTFYSTPGRVEYLMRSMSSAAAMAK